MHCRDAKDMESIEKKTLTFHAGLGPKINVGILTINNIDITPERRFGKELVKFCSDESFVLSDVILYNKIFPRIGCIYIGVYRCV